MSNDPHPLISDGTNDEALREAVRRVAKPIFDRVAKETKITHVSGGGVGSQVSFYNPHNSRYYFNFDRSNLSLRGLGGLVLKPVNHGRELVIDDFFGCRVVVKKRMVEVTNKVDKERVFKVHGSLEMRRELVVDACVVLEREAVFALRKFVELFGGVSDFVPVKVWIADNKILHDGLVDAIPHEVTFRNEVAKKVYKSEPKNVEFSSPVFASNFFRNSGLHDFAPLIAEGLDRLYDDVSLVKRVTYEPLKDKLLSELSDAFLLHDWVRVGSLLRELLVLDRVLFSEVQPLVCGVAEGYGAVFDTFK